MRLFLWFSYTVLIIKVFIITRLDFPINYFDDKDDKNNE